MEHCIKKSVLINVSSSQVWKYLTNPDLLKQWMGDSEMQIEILTDWKVGNPFIIKGFHHQQFENKGTVLEFKPEKVFRYNYLSSLSDLANIPENHTTIRFTLVRKQEKRN